MYISVIVSDRSAHCGCSSDRIICSDIQGKRNGFIGFSDRVRGGDDRYDRCGRTCGESDGFTRSGSGSGVVGIISSSGYTVVNGEGAGGGSGASESVDEVCGSVFEIDPYDRLSVVNK